jgi:hypothetical protein
VLGLIAQAVDDDIFDTTHNPISESDLSHPHVRVLQAGADSNSPILSHHFVSDPEARVVAVVERDADLDAAAQALVRTRFALRGRSPYAPDLVLVNEWVKRDFLEAVIRHAVRFASHEAGKPVPGTSPGKSLSEAVRKEKGVNVLSWSSAGAVVDVNDRSALISLGVAVYCRFKLLTPVQAVVAAAPQGARGLLACPRCDEHRRCH